METYNLKKMQELLKDFYNLTNIKICIYDNLGNELCYYPEKLSSFCSIIRKNETMNKRCESCDKKAISICKQSHEQYIYTCHAGLLECISPIIFDKKIIGYIVIGQIKSPYHNNFNDIKNNIPEEFHNKLKEKFDSLPSINVGKIKSAMRILDACASYEYLKKLIESNENRIDILLDEYINEHLAEDLSVEILCSHFRLCRSEIYSIFKKYFNNTPAEYIKIRRLKYACNLLKNSNLHIYEIAKKCGIPDYNYFSKVFKRTFNITPKNYRKKT